MPMGSRLVGGLDLLLVVVEETMNNAETLSDDEVDRGCLFEDINDNEEAFV